MLRRAIVAFGAQREAPPFDATYIRQMFILLLANVSPDAFDQCLKWLVVDELLALAARAEGPQAVVFR